MLRVLMRCVAVLLVGAAGAASGVCGGAIKWAAAQAAKAPLQVPIVYITKIEKELPPLSLVEPIITDKGVVGARKAMQDNSTTGRLLKQDYQLIETLVAEDGDLVAAFEEQLAAGRRLFVADLHADQLLALANLPGAKS